MRFGQNNREDNGCLVAMTINGLRCAQPRGVAPSRPNSRCRLPPGSISPLRGDFFCHFFSPRKSGFLLGPPPIQFNSILIYLSRVKYAAVIADFYTALQNNTNTKINK